MQPELNNSEREELEKRITYLEKENQRLQISLDTITEHADSFENELLHKQEVLTYYDPLTGLPNRRLFQERFDNVAKLKRTEYENQTIALLMIDIDHFKAINDAFGHSFGDDMLRAVAQRLQLQMDDSQNLSARFGDDEFAILVTDFDSDEQSKQIHQAIALAEKLLAAFQPPFILRNQEVFAACSIGVSIFPQDGEDFAELTKNASTAMHSAKLQGRNNHQFFSATMNNDSRRRMALKNDLQHILERDELELYYQPQIDVHEGVLVGVEALIRWHHPEFGLVSPGEFIPLAEENDLIIAMGEWVLNVACEQIAKWNKEGVYPIRMAVNLSVKQFYDKYLLSIIEELLLRTDVKPHSLELEITESVAMNNVQKTQQMLSSLKALGIDLAIDDFGTGYSSLNYLNKFTVDVLKIDAAFVADIDSVKGAALIRAIVNMAHSLGMKIVAEGVETKEQLNFLRTCQCDIVQGYLFGHPVVASKITQLFKQSSNVFVSL